MQASTMGSAVAIESAGVASAAERLLSRMLGPLVGFVPASVATGLTVGERQTLERIVVLGTRAGALDAALPLIRRLPDLEPIDPFNPRRAAAAGTAVMWAGLVGGPERFAASMYGRHLRRHGYGAPVVAYFRREGRIGLGLMLMRTVEERPFDAGELAVLTRMHPFLEAALAVAATPVLESPAGPAIGDLTAREAEVARFVADGLSNADIALELGMSEATVKAHLTRVYAKLDVRTRTQLAVLLPHPAVRDVCEPEPA